MELMKSILATQRDHGNREVRPNARMKYLVHEKGTTTTTIIITTITSITTTTTTISTIGIDGFRSLVEGYFGKPIDPWRPIKQWEYRDWMGW